MVLADEDPAEAADFANTLGTHLAPNGPLEEVLAERIIAMAWMQRRVPGLLRDLFTHLRLDGEADQARSVAHDLALASFPQDNYGPEHKAALLRSEELKVERDSNPMISGWIRDASGADTLSKVLRYQTTIERSLYRALHELQRLQAARAGQEVSAPAVADIDVAIKAN